MIQSAAEREWVCPNAKPCAAAAVGHAQLQQTAVISALRCYEKELQDLRDENERLRQSAQLFGELAERLNIALRIAAAAMGQNASGATEGPSD